jgi:hypothetical protein
MEQLDRLADEAVNSYEFLYHLRTIHQVLADQVRMADQKATYIFSFITAICGKLHGSRLNGKKSVAWIALHEYGRSSPQLSA